MHRAADRASVRDAEVSGAIARAGVFAGEEGMRSLGGRGGGVAIREARTFRQEVEFVRTEVFFSGPSLDLTFRAKFLVA